MPNQELLDYIKESKKTGQTDEQIKSVLIANGWQEADINNGFWAVISPRKTVSKKKIFLLRSQSLFFWSVDFLFIITIQQNKPKKLISVTGRPFLIKPFNFAIPIIGLLIVRK